MGFYQSFDFCDVFFVVHYEFVVGFFRWEFFKDEAFILGIFEFWRAIVLVDVVVEGAF